MFSFLCQGCPHFFGLQATFKVTKLKLSTYNRPRGLVQEGAVVKYILCRYENTINYIVPETKYLLESILYTCTYCPSSAEGGSISPLLPVFLHTVNGISSGQISASRSTKSSTPSPTSPRPIPSFKVKEYTTSFHIIMVHIVDVATVLTSSSSTLSTQHST